MIKAIIFDLDGVLVDARELHYEALNRALKKFDFTITRDEHLAVFDGLPTNKKLKLLSKNKGLSPDLYDNIWELKQYHTKNIIEQKYTYDNRIRSILAQFMEEGYKMCVCSNSIRETTKIMLERLGLVEYMEFFISNQDVQLPKPNPQMFLHAMVKLGIGPKECIIIEDSHHGRQAAFDSGAHLCAVENSKQVTYEHINSTIIKALKKNKINRYIPKWQGNEMQIVIPMAGEGKSYIKAGYKFPKYLVDIAGKPMIQWVVENINAEAKYIFIVQKDHYEKYNLKYMLSLLVKNSKIVTVENQTEGAPQTILKAENIINKELPLAIINSDQILEWNSNEFFYAMAADDCDGGIVTFDSIHPMYSYVQINKKGFISECAEKKPISRYATAGVYYFRRAKDFISGAKRMIKKEIKIHDQYFVCPVYNELIAKKMRIRKYDIDKIWSFSVPEDLDYFINNYNMDSIK